MNIFKKSLCAALTAGLIVGGPAAVATAQGGNSPAEGLDLETIGQLVHDGDTSSITIHKHETPRGESSDGLPVDVDSAPVAGAEFTIWEYTDVDLTTQAGWEAAAELQENSKDFDPATDSNFRLVDEVENPVTTGEDGTAVFEDLPVGLYFIKETKTPDGYVEGAAPFFVALPMTHPTELNERLDNVHVYPKNEKETVIEKTVDDANQNAGDEINYTLTAPRPSVDKVEGKDGVINVFNFVDTYQNDRVQYVSTDSVEIVNIDSDGDVSVVETLTEGDDYTATDDQADGKVTIELTSAGLDKLTAADADVEVQAKLTFEILPFMEDSEDALPSILNKFDNDVTVNDKVKDIPGDEVETYEGNLKIFKHDSADKGLEGAVFDVYRCDDIENLEDSPIRQGIETGDDGVAYVNGLHVNDFVDGIQQDSDPAGYCLIETKAPDKMELLADPVFFQILKDGKDEVELTVKDIENVDHNAGFNLPLTGGNGIYLLLIAGGFLVIAGGSYYYLQRRKTA